MDKTEIQKAVEKELSKYNMDGWANVLVGLSKKGDKTTSSKYGYARLIEDEELEQIYSGDGLGTKIIDVVADDMTREWIDLESEDIEDPKVEAKTKKIIDLELERIEAQKSFNTALKWARLYGGSVIVIGAEDGNALDQPLDINRIKNLSYLRVVGRNNIFIDQSKFQTDPEKANFGALISLKIQFDIGVETREVDVHPSRCLFFFGKPAPDIKGLKLDTQYWGFSEIQPIYGILADLGTGYQGIVNALYEFSVAVFKIEGLADMMAAGKEEQVINRMEIINTMKSVIHGVMLGESEDYRRENITFAGVSDVIDRLMMRLSGSITVPLTRLFGRSPSGLNATGEGDERIYYDVVRAAQQVKLTKPLRQLITIIQAWKGLKVPFEIEYNPLYQPTEKEMAETDKIKAETAKIKADTYAVYVSMGSLDPDEVFAIELEETFGDVRKKLGIERAKLLEEEEEEEIQEEEEKNLATDGSKKSDSFFGIFRKGRK